ncbi:calcium-binding protein SPEC 2C-like [Ylistrum balloti]|uniref:calcium-binding protein SPEC 2C-like n=1 Tax=Ylistrum balloti TaxID=509963 RepID=UPI002905ECF1|nr:calcium-binding protein SPEC 2C-like [Ylistrum balloti]
MARRKIPKEVQAVFDRYVHGPAKRLGEKEAIEMLQTEFNLSADEAQIMFDSFDKDKNKIMSIWEFQQFYETAGSNAAEAVKCFHDLDTDGSGKLDPEEARKGLQRMKTGTGRNLEEKEIDFFMKTASDDDGMLDIAMFVNLLHRLKLYKSPPPPKNAKCHVLGEK